MDDATLHGCIPVIIMASGCCWVLFPPALLCVLPYLPATSSRRKV
jgi:hypothetical protein